MESCTCLLENLKITLTNLKKAPNRKYKAETLKNKTKTSRETYNKLIEYAAEIPDSEAQNAIVKYARQILSEILSFINTRLEHRTLVPFRTITICIRTFLSIYLKHKKDKVTPYPEGLSFKMAKVDVKLGTSLITVYDGNPDGLDTFIDAATFFIDYVNSENSESTATVQDSAKKLCARFIKTRLTGIAHRIVQGLDSTVEIFEALQQQCSSTVNSDNLRAKLKMQKEKHSVEDFCKDVEQICIQLKNAYIKESIPNVKATQMSIKAGVDTLITGIRSSETKTILKAGKFQTLNEAVQKVLENKATDDDVTKVFYMRNGNYSRNLQNSYRTRPNHFSRGNYNNLNNNSNTRRINNTNRSNSQTFRNNNDFNNSPRNTRPNWRGNNRTNRRQNPNYGNNNFRNTNESDRPQQNVMLAEARTDHSDPSESFLV